MNKLLVAALMGVAGISAPAAAQTFFTNSTGLSAPKTTVTFDEISGVDGSAVTNELAGLGVTFRGAYLNSQDGFFARNYLTNYSFSAGAQSPDLQILFNSVVNEAAFDYVSNGGTSVFNVFNDLTLVGTTTFATGTTPAFFGFSGTTFNRIQLLAPSNGALQIGSVQFSAAAGVPEPASWAMMIGGFGLVGGTMRRRKSNVRTTVTFA